MADRLEVLCDILCCDSLLRREFASPLSGHAQSLSKSMDSACGLRMVRVIVSCQQRLVPLRSYALRDIHLQAVVSCGRLGR
jgi:hypothetical protein